jgi:hypothetical protein
MSAAAPKRWIGPCNHCGREAELETRYDIGAHALCDRCATQLHTAHVVDLETVRASRGATGSPQSSSSPLGSSSHLSPNPFGHEGNEEPEVESLLRLHEAGEIEPVEERFPLVPATVSPFARVVFEDFARIRGLRLWAGDDRPVPYGREWVADRLKRHESAVRRALRELEAAGLIEFVGELPARRKGQRGTKTYLPGRGVAQ